MSYKVLIGILLGMVLASIALFIHPGFVLANNYPCGNGAFGRNGCYGYFTNAQSPIHSGGIINVNNIFPDGLDVTNTTDLFSVIGGDLGYETCPSPPALPQCQNANPQYVIGAAFIVDTMLGENGGVPMKTDTVNDGINYARTHFTIWEGEVTNIETIGTIKWNRYEYNDCYSNSYNTPPSCSNVPNLDSGFSTDKNDAVFHDWIGTFNGGSDDGNAIFFSWTGGQFSLGQSCGNVQGVADALPKVPQPTFSCGSATFTPSNIDPSTQFSVTVTVSNSTGKALSGATMSINVAPTSGGASIYSNAALPTLANSYPTSGTAPPPPGLMKATTAGQYTVTWSLNAPYTMAKPCTTNFAVANYPYLQVYGGDVSINGSPEIVNNGSPPTMNCENNPTNGGIFSWNNDSGTSPNYSGAGTQYAIYALGTIDGFASAQNSTSMPSQPTGLSFNYPGSSGAGSFGGTFGIDNSGDCNFTWDCLFTPNAANCPDNSPNPCPFLCSNLPSTITDGHSKVIVAFGDVYITNNVLYQQNGAGWASPSQIPNFRLVVVGGNIYIKNTVTELDGLYVAEPEFTGNSEVGGTIYTCATGNLSKGPNSKPGQIPNVSPVATDSNYIGNYYTTCNSPLAIYGAFVAQQVEFLRTHGSVGEAQYPASVDCMPLKVGNSYTPNTCNSAETFDYTPELWLPRNTNTTSNGYSSITGLPPVL